MLDQPSWYADSPESGISEGRAGFGRMYSSESESEGIPNGQGVVGEGSDNGDLNSSLTPQGDSPVVQENVAAVAIGVQGPSGASDGQVDWMDNLSQSSESSFCAFNQQMLDRVSSSGRSEVSDQDGLGSLMGDPVPSDQSTDVCESSLIEEGESEGNKRCKSSGFHSLFYTSGITVTSNNGSSDVTPPKEGVNAPAMDVEISAS